MRIGPDVGLTAALSRFQDSQRLGQTQGGSSGFVAFETDASVLPRAKTVTAPSGGGTENRTRKEPQREAAPDGDARAFAREAPAGMRPKYIPKGQTLNLLV
jgi:hypothetical protein